MYLVIQFMRQFSFSLLVNIVLTYMYTILTFCVFDEESDAAILF
jgi:hypothetical protein